MTPVDTQPLVLGLDLGGTKILAGLVDAEGRVHEEWRLPTPTEGGAPAILEALLNAIGTIKDRLTPAQRDRLLGVGVSTAGHVNPRTGLVEYCTPNLPGWGGTRVGEAIAERHGLEVVVDNDANCAAYGEYWLGAGRGIGNLVVITLGTGLGGGVLVEGVMVRGTRGGGGELGHTLYDPNGLPCNCGQRGCIESYVSGTALQKAAERSGYWDPAPTSHDLFTWARAGDAKATELIDEMAQAFAVHLVTVINMVAPDRILVGGGLSLQGDFFLPMVREHVAKRYGERGWDTSRLQPAELGEKAGMIGAAGEAFARFAPERVVAVR